MFSSTNPSPLARRLFGALDLVRSFLLLEDDYDVDWEVDQDELVEASGCGSRSSDWNGPERGDHPHRVVLQSRLSMRRPGVPVAREQVCLCPVGGRARAGVTRSPSPLNRFCVDH